MTHLAERNGVPYRSLQNYLYKKTTMPVDVYLTVCEQLGVPPDYPRTGRFKIPHHALQDSIEQVLKPVIARLSFDNDMNLTVTANDAIEKGATRRTAGTLAVLINAAYDTSSELETHRTLADE